MQVAQVDAIAVSKSAYFDPEYYAKAAKISGDPATLARHYILNGERDNIRPSEKFDPSFYGWANQDVEAESVNKLLHYIRYGYKEARYPSPAKLRSDVAFLLETDSVDESYIAKNFILDRSINLGLIEQCVASWRTGSRPNQDFDPIFYYNFYEDVNKSGLHPFIHYIRFGQCDGRVTNEKQLGLAVTKVASGIDADYYARQIDLDQEERDNKRSLAEHYIKVGYFRGLNPHPDFDLNFYLALYPDIADNGLEPFQHYLEYGRHEGRLGNASASSYINRGEQPYDANKSTILIACHEASRTGAPLVGLNLVASLRHEYNIISYLGRHGELTDLFRQESVLIVEPVHGAASIIAVFHLLKKQHNLSAVILNSIETDLLVPAIIAAELPSIALIHEFSQYTLPKGRVSDVARLVNRVIVPAEIIKLSLDQEIQNICANVAPNISIRPQGRLPWLPQNSSDADLSYDELLDFLRDRCPGRNKYVLGAGYVGIRKGVESFVQVAAKVNESRQDVAFLWIGGGFHPQSDLQYSVWINEMIQRMGLSSVVQFLGEQSNLDSALELSNLFFLSSRLDPFPNVVIDALQANKPIVCFEGATGCSELIDDNVIDGAAVPYLDVQAAADAVSRFIDGPTSRRNNVFANTQLKFESYVAFIKQELNKAVRDNNKNLVSAAAISKSREFDSSFYSGRPARTPFQRRLIMDYAASASKGLARRNPRPGFSEDLYREKNDISLGEVPLAVAATKSNRVSISTHSVIDAFYIPQEKQQLRCAVHIHLHYPDLSGEFVRRLKSKGRMLDLIITVNTDRAFFEVKQAFPKRNFGNVVVLKVPNKGRDLGSFLIDLPSNFDLTRYDLIGHLHGKKSLVLGGKSGETWRSFLLDTLLGRRGEMFEKIHRAFSSDPSLGLVFAEDPHRVGWSGNKAYGEKLVERIHPRPKIKDHIVFPVGTMFWARPDALLSLWKAGFTYDDFPAEPLPYDGSILHAIERLIPAICEANGYRWHTVINTNNSR